MTVGDHGQKLQRKTSFGQHRGSPLDDFIFRLRVQRILRRFPPTARVAADLGSGHDYRLLRYLTQRSRIEAGIAVDLVLDQTTNPSIRLIQADLGQPLQIDTSSVDVVLSLAVLEHLDDPALHLREIHRVLRTSGMLLLTSPSRSAQPMLEFLAYRLHVIDATEIRDHRHYFSEAEIRALLIEAGFATATIEYSTFLLGLNQFVNATK